MQNTTLDSIILLVKFFWRKINNWPNEKKSLKKEIKRPEDKYKNLLESEKKKTEKLNNENAKLNLKLENQEKIKNYLQEKKFFIENYYRRFILRLDGYVCSFKKEKEIIFSLLNLFAEEYLQAFYLKEKIFRRDFALFEEFFSLRPSNFKGAVPITDKNLVIRDCLVRANLYATVKGNYRRIGKIGIDKLNFLMFIIDDYIQKQAIGILNDYFVFYPYSSFVEKSATRLSSLLKARF